MNREKLIKGLDQLGKLMCALGENKEWVDFRFGVTSEEYQDFQQIIAKQKQLNGWFTEENVRSAFLALGSQMNELQLTEWIQQYPISKQSKRVGIIMAGNLPMVGFHDLLCVILSGHRAVCKLSSDDKVLLPALLKQLENWIPELADNVVFTNGPIGEIDAVIATGSDNSALYFEQYFGKYPHIFRSSRTSVALISGDETEDELRSLGNDLFQYYGLGCRNVSYILFPKGYDLNLFFNAIVPYGEIINHHKYANNYDYNRTVFLLNKIPILDNNFVILRESEDLFSPLAVIHYQYYNSSDQVMTFLSTNAEKIQAVVGKGYIPFGQAQCPKLNDYADGVDTMEFLSSL